MYSKNKVGFLIALEKEATILINMLENRCDEKIGRMIFHKGTLTGVDVVIVVTGIGKVLAASATALLINNYKPSLLVSTGVAGGLGVSKLFDVVVATSVSQHDIDTTPIGDLPGLIPQVNLTAIPTCKECINILRLELPHAHFGNVASGDQFVSSIEKRNFIVKTFNSIACDMECGAVGQIALLEGTPFIAIKLISDDADDSAPVSFETFIDKAAAINVATILKSITKFASINYTN
ncbi:MAG: 5'-methylthioadenosine/adenosylhomocysteine nucleosidase [Christensenellaceae bacterium]|jgi:adenosylhomocysteine nucleosidase|nr:5'-methylthioadenosine/adenosylhomocysteine nucleosidase [Christensenellaceae bacterium]